MRSLRLALAVLLLVSSAAIAQTPPTTIIAGRVKSLGYCQITSLASATNFAAAAPAGCGGVPAGANFVDIIVEGNGIRYRTDGTAPTAAVGMPLGAGTDKNFALSNLGAMQFIQQAATPTTAVLNLEFYQ